MTHFRLLTSRTDDIKSKNKQQVKSEGLSGRLHNEWKSLRPSFSGSGLHHVTHFGQWDVDKDVQVTICAAALGALQDAALDHALEAHGPLAWVLEGMQESSTS